MGGQTQEAQLLVNRGTQINRANLSATLAVKHMKKVNMFKFTFAVQRQIQK